MDGESEDHDNGGPQDGLLTYWRRPGTFGCV